MKNANANRRIESWAALRCSSRLVRRRSAPRRGVPTKMPATKAPRNASRSSSRKPTTKASSTISRREVVLSGPFTGVGPDPLVDPGCEGEQQREQPDGRHRVVDDVRRRTRLEAEQPPGSPVAGPSGVARSTATARMT